MDKKSVIIEPVLKEIGDRIFGKKGFFHGDKYWLEQRGRGIPRTWLLFDQGKRIVLSLECKGGNIITAAVGGTILSSEWNRERAASKLLERSGEVLNRVDLENLLKDFIKILLQHAESPIYID